MNLTTKGVYRLAGDTIILITHQKGIAAKNAVNMRYLLSDGMLVTLPKGTGLVFLGITVNKLNPPD